MIIHILHDIRSGPWGGGNQFLKSLREVYRRDGDYAEDAEEAQVILFNSHQKLDKALLLKRRNPDTTFVHRVDGPVSKIRDSHPRIDGIIYRMNRALADGTVFQSSWSRDRNRTLGMPKSRFETVVMNAPDPRWFHAGEKRLVDPGRKMRLVATSWSSHANKGFDTYRWMDEHLDFSQWDMTFIGRSPVAFKNIRMMDPLPSADLAEQLRQHDVFITASQKDPCSNALIEALHCGLPALGLNDGGHPEIIGPGGALFDQPEEIPDLLERIRTRYDVYRESIRVPSLESVAAAYKAFMERIHQARITGVYPGKSLSPGDWRREAAALLAWSFMRRAEGLAGRLARLRKDKA